MRCRLESLSRACCVLRRNSNPDASGFVKSLHRMSKFVGPEEAELYWPIVGRSRFKTFPVSLEPQAPKPSALSLKTPSRSQLLPIRAQG